MLRIYYTADHQWVNLTSGYCGFTQHAFDMHSSYKIRHKMCSLYRVRAGDVSGKILADNKEIAYVISPVTGVVAQINTYWLPRYADVSWTHRVEIEDYIDDLMTYDEYSRYLGEA